MSRSAKGPGNTVDKGGHNLGEGEHEGGLPLGGQGLQGRACGHEGVQRAAVPHVGGQVQGGEAPTGVHPRLRRAGPLPHQLLQRPHPAVHGRIVQGRPPCWAPGQLGWQVCTQAGARQQRVPQHESPMVTLPAAWCNAMTAQVLNSADRPPRACRGQFMPKKLMPASASYNIGTPLQPMPCRAYQHSLSHPHGAPVK